MTHPSPTALEEIRKRHDRDDVNEFTRRFFGPFHEDRAALLTHIAALEAERDEAVKMFVRGRESNDALHTSALHWRERAEKAEAQLATRLPTAQQNELAELCRNLIQNKGLSADYAMHALDIINPQLVELARAYEDLSARHAKLTGKYQAALAVALDKSTPQGAEE